jgi:hypothetical protein
MNQTIQEAAEAYTLNSPYGSETYSNSEIAEVETKAFIAGGEWAIPKMVPVAEWLPTEKGMYLVFGKKSWEDEFRLHITRFIPQDEFNAYGFIGIADPLAWCPIPDSLLNFKP